jgi:acyl-CoA synthetase (AMP-forming)/AMP-acid ligase II/acyl carrier protein
MNGDSSSAGAPSLTGLGSALGPVETLHALLAHRASLDRDRRAYTYLGTEADESLTFAELDVRARAIAARLQQVCHFGDRVLLVFPAGLDFITSFFGCLYAGVLAVPATYPKPRRPMPRLAAIARDCGSHVVLSTTQTITTVDQSRDESGLPEMEWIAVDDLSSSLATEYRRSEVISQDLAFLQYTSGSTSQPRGVMVSHGNLLHNLGMIRQGFAIDKIVASGETPTGVFWLPAYHDMGLIGGILESLFVGGHSVLMSPAAFLQRPLGWLEAITRFRASISGAPNFAFELCVSRTTPDQIQSLDLSSWRVAFCGAEPIRPETLERFQETFAPVGFRDDAFYPCYGLAEGTLLAAGSNGPRALCVHRFSRQALERNRVQLTDGDDDLHSQRLVGCGQALAGQEIAIVDPHLRSRCAADQIGEIWVKGPSVAQGYWHRGEDSESFFRAYLADDGDGPYLRTGDLGFFAADNLFITGRVKDVIIIRGRNHYPQDIEQSVSECHSALRHDSGAVFAVERNGREQLVIIQEVDRQYRQGDFDEISRTIRRTVSEEHELEIYAVVLIRHASLPRTTSGKVQRHLSRQQFEKGELKEINRWVRPDLPAPTKRATMPDKAEAKPASSQHRFVRPDHPMTVEEVDRLAERVESWLLTWMVERAAVPQHEVDRNKPFAEYGLDSLTAVELSHELEDWLGVEVVPTVAWNYPTPATLSKYLARAAAGVEEASETDVGATSAADDEFSRLLAEIENLSEEEAQKLLDQDGSAGTEP